jgi:hypothetical protein
LQVLLLLVLLALGQTDAVFICYGRWPGEGAGLVPEPHLSTYINEAIQVRLACLEINPIDTFWQAAARDDLYGRPRCR